VSEKKPEGEAGKSKVNQNDPIPHQRKRKKKVADLRGVEYTRLQRRKERDTGEIVGVPERKLEGLYEMDPEITGWYKEG
jgi:hypothetical protein